MEDVNRAPLPLGMYCDMHKWSLDNYWRRGLDAMDWLYAAQSIAQNEHEHFNLSINHPKMSWGWSVGFENYPRFKVDYGEAVYDDDWDDKLSLATFKAIMARYARIEEKAMQISVA